MEWTCLFAPAALLVAVTAQIATDVASAPFLWVIPLALFLATFVLVFRQREIVPPWLPLAIQPALAAAIAIALEFLQLVWVPIALALHLLAFFVSALVCHGALYARRRYARYLTGFYLFMSFGGALGGAFSGLAAPHLFNTVAEYPMLIVLALVARPRLAHGSRAARSWRPARPRRILGVGVLALRALLRPSCSTAAAWRQGWPSPELSPFLRELAMHWKRAASAAPRAG